jgi:fructokinase
VAVPTSTRRTSVATARLDESGAASYDFDLEWSLPRRELPPCRALHVGSLGTLLEPGRQSVLDLVEQARARNVFISYDANLREPFIDDRARVRRQVLDLGRRCGLVKLSDEDALLIDPAADPDDVARTLLGGDRTQLVVLTRGADGATAFTAEGETTVRPRQVEMVDTVGAGDAFMSGTLAQLSDLDAFRPPGPGAPVGSEDTARLLRGAMEVAAITCERRGASPPRREELPPGWPA